MCIAVCLAAHAPNLFIVAPRYLRGELGFGESDIGAVMGAFPLASLVAMAVWARVAERVGARNVVLVGATLVVAGAVLFERVAALAPLVASRALMGLGWSGVLVGASIAVTLLARPGRLAQALGTAGVLTLVAMAMGPMIGELVAAHAGWPWVFRGAALAATAGLLVAATLPRLVPASPQRAEATAADGAGGWRLPAPVLRPLAAMLLVATGFGAVVSFLADHAHLRADSGIAPFFDAYVATAIAARLGASSLSDRVGRHPVILPSLLGQAAGLAGLALFGARWQLWALGALYGITHGLYYPALQALIVERAPAERRARAVASSNLVFAIGMALAAFGGGALAEQGGYSAVYFAVGGASVAAAAVLLVDRGAASGGGQGQGVSA